MSERSTLLVQQWLQQWQAADTPLQEIVADYPYFSAAQLLFLKSLDKTSANYTTQKSKAALHVYNPIELEERDEMFQIPFDEMESIARPIEDEDVGVAEELDPVAFTEPVSIEEKEFETFEERELPAQIESTETNEPELATASLEEENIEEEQTAELSEKAAADEQADEPHFAEPVIKMPAFDLNAPPTASAQDITFEPFHTVDYFASQGIKLSQQEAGSDRFGKQLKSFTEWLKTMKKIPTTAITHNTDGAGESKVVNLAAHSLENTDIITESMAEVWVKQGNIQKASEVYNKLSLQNPSKKAYFAAKIESLKKPS